MGDVLRVLDRDKLVIKYLPKKDRYFVTELVMYSLDGEIPESLLKRANGLVNKIKDQEW
jgi:hypothetical protein